MKMLLHRLSDMPESHAGQRKHLTNSPKHPKMIEATTSLTLTVGIRSILGRFAQVAGNHDDLTHNFLLVLFDFGSKQP